MAAVLRLVLMVTLMGFSISKNVSGTATNGSAVDEDLSGARRRRQAYNPGQFEGTAFASVYWLVARYTDVRVCMATIISYNHGITACECVVYLMGLKWMEEGFIRYKVDADSHEGWIKYSKQERDSDGKLIIASRNGEPVKLKPNTDLYIQSLTNPTRITTIEELYKHNQCGSFFLYNVALIKTTAPVVEEISKAAWLHTPEEILFNNNLKRLEAGSTLLGNCRIPWSDPSKTEFVDVSARVYFQHWSVCRPLFCSAYDKKYKNFDEFAEAYEEENKEVPYVWEICDGRVEYTKQCVFVDLDPVYRIGDNDKCSLPAGTPVFCYADRISGLVGFLVKETFGCAGTTESTGTSRLAILQPLDIALNWIRPKLLEDPMYPKPGEPNDYFPQWIWSVKKLTPDQLKESTDAPKKFQEPNPEAGDVLEVFATDSTDAIVNIHVGEERDACYGVQVAPKKFAVPCFCVHEYEDQAYREEHSVLKWADLTQLESRFQGALQPVNVSSVSVSLVSQDTDVGNSGSEGCIMIEKEEDYEQEGAKRKLTPIGQEHSGNPLCFRAKNILKSPRCDGRLFADFALLETHLPVKYAKTVWLPTSNADFFQKAWTTLQEASLIEGHCFYLSFTHHKRYIAEGQSATTVTVQRIPFVFAPFELCTPLICDPDSRLVEHIEQEFCLNKVAEVSEGPPGIDVYSATRTRSANQSRDCIRTKEKSCGIVNGSPIFCDLADLRGLVGFVSNSTMPGCWDTAANPEGKLPRDIMEKTDGEHSAIVMRIDMFLDSFKEQTLVYELENSEELKTRSGCPQPKNPPHDLLVLLAAPLTLFEKLFG